jgi:hypothetical protein
MGSFIDSAAVGIFAGIKIRLFTRAAMGAPHR